MKTEKKILNGGGPGYFGQLIKKKVYLEQAINELKDLLRDEQKTEKDLLSIFINRYEYQSIYPHKEKKEYNNDVSMNVYNFYKREFAYRKYKYYLILYCFYSTLTNKNKTTKIEEKQASFQMELQKTSTNNKSQYVADKIVFYKPGLLRNNLKYLLRKKKFNEARELCISAFEDDKYTQGGFSTISTKKTPFGFIILNNGRSAVSFKKNNFMDLTRGKSNSDKVYTINEDTYKYDIERITGTIYNTSFYKQVIETSSIGKAIRERLNELGVRNGINLNATNQQSEENSGRQGSIIGVQQEHGGGKKSTTKKPLKKTTTKKPIKKPTTKKPTTKKTVTKKPTTKKSVKKTTTKKSTTKKPTTKKKVVKKKTTKK